jgi:hypothetical protein
MMMSCIYSRIISAEAAYSHQSLLGAPIEHLARYYLDKGPNAGLGARQSLPEEWLHFPTTERTPLHNHSALRASLAAFLHCGLCTSCAGASPHQRSRCSEVDQRPPAARIFQNDARAIRRLARCALGGSTEINCRHPYSCRNHAEEALPWNMELKGTPCMYTPYLQRSSNTEAGRLLLGGHTNWKAKMQGCHASNKLLWQKSIEIGTLHRSKLAQVRQRTPCDSSIATGGIPHVETSTQSLFRR